MNSAKIRLSTKEMVLVTNADFILTKNAILQKGRSLLEELSVRQEEFIQQQKHRFPEPVMTPRAKISRGENYLGLPYLILDHPRYFNRENVFAIRTMFWWGHFFSITLQLSGQYKSRYEEQIIRAYRLLKKKEIYYCTNEDPWQHHFEENNYQPVGNFSERKFSDAIKSGEFIKLSGKISLEEWSNAPEILLKDFQFFLDLLNS